jgi:transposase
VVLRAKIVLLAAKGWGNKEIAGELACDVKTVRKWRDRFSELRLAGLQEAPRDGRPAVFTSMQRHEVLAKVLTTPPEGLTRWTSAELSAVAVRENIVESISRATVGRWLRAADLKPHRNKYWLNPKDPDFRPKMERVVNVYTKPPKDGIVLCLDEKTGMQALERIAPDKPAKSGMVRKIEFEYKRHGVANLMASFNTRTGEVVGKCIDSNNSATFIEFVKDLMEHYPKAQYGKLYLVLDNGSSHTSHETQAFFAKNKRLVPIFLPTHASWLNQIEIWFSVLSRKSLKHYTCTSAAALKKHIMDFIGYYNRYNKHPYRWTFKGQPLAAG